VDVVTMLWAGWPRNRISLLSSVQTGSGAHPLGSIPGVVKLDHSSSAKVKNTWRCTFTVRICLHGMTPN
jgi:hypothetical protein